MKQGNNNPKTWQLLPLKEILNIEVGDDQATKDIADAKGTIPYIQSGDVKNTKDIRIRFYTTRDRIEAKGMKPDQKVLTKERLLLAMARLGTAGRVGIFREAAIHNQATAALIPIIPIDIDFLFYYFRYRQPLVAQEVEKHGKPRITKKYLQENIFIPLPPGGVEEEKRIVERLEARLREVQQGYKLIENTQREITNAFNKALLNIFTPEQIEKWPGTRRIELRNMVDTIQERVVQQNAQLESYLYIDETHITPERGLLHTRSTWQAHQESIESSIILLEQAQDVVLYYKSNALARLAVLLDVDQALCSTTMIPLRVRKDRQKDLLPGFLLWSLLSKQFLAYVTTNKQGMMQTSPSVNKVLSYELPLPDINMQRDIVKHLMRVQEITHEMQEKADDSRNKLTRVERAIFQKAFQGEL
ncbi:hypothetical protein KSF_063220 [Reticulibacter mediterranei]|uniref:Type I restriction modification DNA specificity domain-containing protein n=1 Tax=Reticulibacter mediterranei TaxID=2778369 RepID=A0A8J3IQV4_9CHLR|nr:restriction endonuclease subunit S [Reticulibacter mediterranei]GHO96274.1 hypothetical protein KSF_063220 [Reticulibacter mediterranei]